MLNIIRPKESQRASKKLETQQAVVSRPLALARGIHVTVDAHGNFVGVPDEWQSDMAAVFSVNQIDKTPENLDKAANVAQTSFKLRLKNRFPKNMRLEEAEVTAGAEEPVEGPRLRRNMPVGEIMAEIRALCRTGNVTKVYRMVGGVLVSWCVLTLHILLYFQS